MIVDDSAVIRGLLTREIEAAPDLSVAASVSNGEMALMELRRRPIDVIELDIEGLAMDGITALPLLSGPAPVAAR